MNIGVVGLGKVGLPLAQALSNVAGHDVMGLDIDLEAVEARFQAEDLPGDLVELTDDVYELIGDRDPEIVFVVVPTPHAPEYGGEQPMPDDPEDFDYSYLKEAVNALNLAAEQHYYRNPVVGIVSTVLPGTIKREIKPLAGNLRLVYCPAFISLGTVLADLLNPDLVLIGTDDHEAGELVGDALRGLYRNMKAIHWCTFESAELIKVAINCRVSMDIIYTNLLAEICSKVGGDIDQVTGTMERFPRWIPRAGMGDGGACRPRDLIAMSWLAEELGLSVDLFGGLAKAKELQSSWLAWEITTWAGATGLPICILGTAYKPWVTYTDGSPSLLLAHQLNDRGHTVVLHDPHVAKHAGSKPFTKPHVYVLGTKHPEFREVRLPEGSVMVDPWGYWLPQDGITFSAPGRQIT